MDVSDRELEGLHGTQFRKRERRTLQETLLGTEKRVVSPRSSL